MIIPTGKGQANLIFGGTAYPRGAQVTFGFDNDGPLSAADAAGAIAGLWVARFIPVQSNQLSLMQVKVKLGPNSTGAEATVSVGEPGTVASQAESSQAAVLVKKVTVLGSRIHTGRMFIPGASETQSDGGGLLNAAALAAWQTAADNFLGDLTTGVIPMLLLHSDATTPDAVTSLSVAQLMATQRRRIRRTGGRRAVAP